jgi:hypothetical protein
MKTLGKLGLLFGLIGIVAFTAPLSASDRFSDEWKISVSGSAVTAGSISFTLTFEPDSGGMTRDPITIDTPVAANTSEDAIVGLIGDSFSTALGEDDFDVDISWGEHIEIKAEEDTPNIALTVASNTLQGVSIKIKD